MSDQKHLEEEAKPIKDEKGKYTLVPSIIDNKQIEFIFTKTPAHHVKQRPGKGGGQWDYVSGVYIKKVLNYLSGWLWDFEVLDKGNVTVGEKIVQVWVQGKLTLKRMNPNTKEIETTITKTQFGGADVKYLKSSPKVPLDYANDLKAATTDALKKCASELGIASDIYGKDEFREIEQTEKQPAPKKTEQKKTEQKKTEVDYLARLKAELRKKGAQTEQEAVNIFNNITGMNIKSLKIAQSTAKKYLYTYKNSPMANQ
jgi:hypothetical protein